MKVAQRVMLAFSLVIVLIGLALATVPTTDCEKPPFVQVWERSRPFTIYGPTGGRMTPSGCAVEAGHRLWVAGTILVGGIIAGIGGAWILRPSGGTPDS